jgi:two-component system, chemotaxis family, protein-glutamate methylesterase/glutaminase
VTDLENRRRDLVVVGGSAGGVEALKAFVAALPADLPAAVLVALHVPPTSRSMLAGILDRAGPLPAVQAEDGMPLEHGRIIVAHPDAHLLVMDGTVVRGPGARENGHRPSHDAMMRSAALARGSRVVGVVLTGLLDDGAAGLVCVERYGGVCLVQDPDDADFSSMPRHALAAVPSARSVPLADLAEEVVRAVAEEAPEVPEVPEDLRIRDEVELTSALGQAPRMPDGSPAGQPSPYGCPDCHGVLNTITDEGLLRFRCRTGHAWTADSLVAKQSDSLEEALWTALRVLEERIDISHRLADLALQNARPWSEGHFRDRAAEAGRSAEAIRAMLQHPPDEGPLAPVHDLAL